MQVNKKTTFFSQFGKPWHDVMLNSLYDVNTKCIGIFFLYNIILFKINVINELN